MLGRPLSGRPFRPELKRCHLDNWLETPLADDRRAPSKSFLEARPIADFADFARLNGN